MKSFLLKYKKGLIIGFLVGAILFPFLATMGIISHFFELIRPVLIGPMDWIGSYIPDRQLGPDTFEAPVYKWIVVLGFNGLVYAVIGSLIQKLIKSK